MPEAAPIKVSQSETFKKWLNDLKDIKGRSRILVRMDRLAQGNPGDVKSLGNGISEMRLDFGPGYRIYIKWIDDKTAVVLLCGGDKGSQDRDIERAMEIAEDWSTTP